MLVAEKSSSGNAGNGTPTKRRSRRDGADPPKKERGITFWIEIHGWTHNCVSKGNECCINDRNDSHAESEAL